MYIGYELYAVCNEIVGPYRQFTLNIVQSVNYDKVVHCEMKGGNLVGNLGTMFPGNHEAYRKSLLELPHLTIPLELLYNILSRRINTF